MPGPLVIRMDTKLVIRKNILDTDLQKYLQLASVSVIISFTYLIGIAVASLTHQINWRSLADVGILIILTIFVLGLSSFFFIKSILKIKRITKAIRDLDKV